jgi:hypothetical protein
MSTEPDDIPAGQLRTMQIIAAAMMNGIVLPLALFVFLVTVKQQKPILTDPADLQMVSMVALLLLATNAPLSLLLPSIMTRNALRQIAARESPLADLLPLRQTTLIVGLALLEGVAMVGCIAFLLECHAVDFIVVGLVLALMLARFPTRNRVRAWLARQLAVLEELRIRGA